MDQISMALNNDNCTLCGYCDYDGDEEKQDYVWFCIKGLKTRTEVINKAPIVTKYMSPCPDYFINTIPF